MFSVIPSPLQVPIICYGCTFLILISFIPAQRTCYQYSTLDEVHLSVLRFKLGTHYVEANPMSSNTEVATRIAGLYCAQILATGFSGLIAAGVFEGLDGVRGLEGWRW